MIICNSNEKAIMLIKESIKKEVISYGKENNSKKYKNEAKYL